MADLSAQTVRHRRLSVELKRMREEAGVTIDEAAEALGAYRTKIHRIERGEWKRLREDDLRTLAALYKAGERYTDALVSMAKQASVKGWWTRYSDVLGPGSYVSLESQASSLRFYSGMLIPGLLQTQGYAVAVMQAGRITSEAEVQRRVEARLARQSLLGHDSGPAVQAIIDQAALNKAVGGPLTMAEQILHLIHLIESGQVTVGVLPDERGAHVALTGQFVILDFPGGHEDSAVFIDNAHTGIFLEEADEVRDYNGVFAKAWDACLTGSEARDYLSRMARRFIAGSQSDSEDS